MSIHHDYMETVLVATGLYDKARGPAQPDGVISGLAGPATTEVICMETETSRYACHACLGDKVLAKQVEDGETRAECTYCSAKGPAAGISELSACIHRVVEEHFEPKPYFLQTPSEEQTADLWFHYRGYLADTQTVIREVAGIADLVVKDVREFLFLQFAEDADARVEGYNPYHQHMLYDEREGDPSEFRMAWREFRNEIQHQSRFFSTTAAARLKEIFADLTSRSSGLGGSVIRKINPGDSDSYFWRGRLAYSREEAKRIVDAPSKEMGPPPTDKAKAGRMNSEGIPVFYGALDEETCLAEIRAPAGSYAALGRFALLTPVRILDLGALSMSDTEVSHFDPKYSETRSRHKFLWEWVREMSRPVMPHEEAREYLASQAVADYLANREDLRLDGMIFRSSQNSGTGRNIVLFNRACRVEPDDPNPKTGMRFIMPPPLTVPPPGTDSNAESTVQTDPPKPQEEGQLQDETVANEDLARLKDDRSITLNLDRDSLKFLEILGVKHDFKAIEKDVLHYLTISSTLAPMSSRATLSVRNLQ